MRFHNISLALMLSFLAVSSLEAQILSGGGGNVTTTASGSTGISATATTVAAPDVVVNTGDSTSTSAFRVFNSSHRELLRVQSNGTIGMGTMSTATWAYLTPIDSVNSAIGFGTVTDLHLVSNAYYDGQWKYKEANAAANYYLYHGSHAWRVAASGAANSPIHWIDAMTISNTGMVGIGIPAPNHSLDVIGPMTIGADYSTSDQVPANGLIVEGGLGIGTSSPFAKLEIGPSLYPVQFLDGTTQGLANGYVLNMAGSSEIHVSGLQIGSTALPVIQAANTTSLYLNRTTGGDVIIGTTTKPSNLTVTGTVYANYQDLAEWVPAAESMIAGTVVVISDDANNTVTASTRAYDTGVAGVVSPTPGLLLGTASASKAKIATTGRVKVRVDASKGPIRKGDLLVTSDRPGLAMKSEPLDVAGVKMHRPGTLIGKALEPLAGGEGEILVLLSLQ
jgi:hypothetical protein